MITKHQALSQLLTQSITSPDVYRTALACDPIEHKLLLTQTIFLAVLDKFLTNTLDEDELEQWALFVSHNQNIDATQFEDYLLALTEPDLMGGITHENISKMYRLLNKD